MDDEYESKLEGTLLSVITELYHERIKNGELSAKNHALEDGLQDFQGSSELLKSDRVQKAELSKQARKISNLEAMLSDLKKRIAERESQIEELESEVALEKGIRAEILKNYREQQIAQVRESHSEPCNEELDLAVCRDKCDHKCVQYEKLYNMYKMGPSSTVGKSMLKGISEQRRKCVNKNLV